MIGVYINDSKAPFTSWILLGLKKYETRKARTLARFVGENIAIIQTGTGKPRIVGYATIDAEITYYCKPETITLDVAEKIENAMINGTPYEWSSGKKVFYRLKNVKPCKPYPVPENAKKTRVYAEWEE